MRGLYTYLAFYIRGSHAHQKQALESLTFPASANSIHHIQFITSSKSTNMGFFDFIEARDARDQLYSNDDRPSSKPNLGHEILGGAAAFEAMHLWEKEQRRKGEPVSHGFAKEALAAMAGAEADKLWERHHGRDGGNERDRERGREHARRQVEELYDQQYGERDEWNPNHEIHESMRFSGY
ncbi:hypothetical protein QC764_208890 [Podospora pseudoanserina]|nr:hypothetical protein QC764_208890 [Podospora pseudoanserina]